LKKEGSLSSRTCLISEQLIPVFVTYNPSFFPSSTVTHFDFCPLAEAQPSTAPPPFKGLSMPLPSVAVKLPGRPSQYPRHFPTLSDPLRNKEIVTMAYYLPLFPGRESQAELHSPRSFEGSSEILVLSRCILGFEAHSRV
jgi:hypothetical protein